MTFNGENIVFDVAGLPAMAVEYLREAGGHLDMKELSRICPFAGKIGEFAMNHAVSIIHIETEQANNIDAVLTKDIRVEPTVSDKKVQQIFEIKEAELLVIENDILRVMLPKSNHIEEFQQQERTFYELTEASAPTIDQPPAKKAIETSATEPTKVNEISSISTPELEITSILPAKVTEIQPLVETEDTLLELTAEELDTPLDISIQDESSPVDATVETPLTVSLETEETTQATRFAEVIQTWFTEIQSPGGLEATEDTITVPNEPYLVETAEVLGEFVAELTPLFLELSDDISVLEIDKLIQLEEACIELFASHELTLDAAQAKVLVRRLVETLRRDTIEPQGLSIEFLNYIGTDEHRLSGGLSTQHLDHVHGLERVIGVSKYLLKQLSVQPAAA